jgi:acetolactate decarboxylase
VNVPAGLQAQQVHTSGAARNVMMGIDLRATVALDTLLKKPHLVALGPVDDLQGEITVIDGRVFVSAVRPDGSLAHRSDSTVKAPFLAYSYVSEWKESREELNIADWETLQNWIGLKAEELGWPPGEAFPFRIEGYVDFLKYHVIRRDQGREEHNHELHHQAKVPFEWQHCDLHLLGFYSTRHEGVFTHKGQYMHLHVADPVSGANGHVDALRMKGLFSVYIPSIPLESKDH